MRYKSYCKINYCMISCVRYKVALWEIKLHCEIKSHNCSSVWLFRHYIYTGQVLRSADRSALRQCCIHTQLFQHSEAKLPTRKYLCKTFHQFALQQFLQRRNYSLNENRTLRWLKRHQATMASLCLVYKNGSEYTHKDQHTSVCISRPGDRSG